MVIIFKVGSTFSKAHHFGYHVSFRGCIVIPGKTVNLSTFHQHQVVKDSDDSPKFQFFQLRNQNKFVSQYRIEM